MLVLVFSVSNVGFGLITATIAKSSRRSHRLELPLRASATVPWHIRGRITLRCRTNRRQIRPQLLRHRRINFAVPQGRLIRKRNHTGGLRSSISVMRCYLSSRHSALREILQNLSPNSFPFFACSLLYASCLTVCF